MIAAQCDVIVVGAATPRCARRCQLARALFHVVECAPPEHESVGNSRFTAGAMRFLYGKYRRSASDHS
jgi:hypothetical protein